MTGGLGSVAVRVPSHPALRYLLQRVETGLAAPSANPCCELSPTRAAHVLAKLGGRIDAVLDGGPCTLGIEATILDLTGARPTIARPGPVSASASGTVIGMPVAEFDPRAGVPGSEAVHYLPAAPAFLVAPTELESAIEATRRAGLRVGVLLIEGRNATGATACQRARLSDEPQDYAAGLHAALHELDGLGSDRILVQFPPDDPGWCMFMITCSGPACLGSPVESLQCDDARTALARGTIVMRDGTGGFPSGLPLPASGGTQNSTAMGRSC